MPYAATMTTVRTVTASRAVTRSSPASAAAIRHTPDASGLTIQRARARPVPARTNPIRASTLGARLQARSSSPVPLPAGMSPAGECAWNELVGRCLNGGLKLHQLSAQPVQHDVHALESCLSCGSGGVNGEHRRVVVYRDREGLHAACCDQGILFRLAHHVVCQDLGGY